MDTAAGQSVSVVPLKNANALDIAQQLTKMLDPGAIGSTDATLKVQITADPRTNSLLIRASNGGRLAAAKTLAKELDAPTSMPGNIHVVPLRNADATKLAKTLRGMLGKGDTGSSASSNEANSFNQNGSGGAGGGFGNNSTGNSGTPPLPSGGLGGGGSLGSSGGGSGGYGSNGGAGSAGLLGGDKDKGDDNQPGGMIQADAASNSLIITAAEPVYRNLRAVIDQLDARRAQVYIEALIVELNSNTNANLGIQWQVANSSIYAGTNLTTGNTGNSIVNLTGAAALAAATAGSGGLAGALAGSSGLQQGLNVGWIHNIFGVQGLGALLQALSQTADANVLSTPNLITLDNEEAKIVVGTNVPIQTGSYSNLTSSTASSAFNTYDRVDVGLTLHVKPQITDGGILKLQLYTEDSAIVNGTTNVTTNPAGPQFTKRSIQSTVLADNGEIIVLGGLMQDNYQVSNSKVPLLGDIPWIGQLFRSEQKTRNKTNLMVFLRPVIINDRSTAQAVTSNRYDYIQGVQGAYKSDNRLIKDNDDPVMPPMPIGPSQGGSAAMNLFDLDQMRRQQMTRPPLNLPQPANGGAVQTNPVPSNNGAVQTNPVPSNNGAVQSSPTPSTAAPGVQP